MGIDGYKAITWEPLDLVSDWNMDQMTANIQAVHDFTPRAKYTVQGGISTAENVKILSGRRVVPKNGKSPEQSVDVGFGTFFSSNCQPNVTIGINSRVQQNIFATFRGQPGQGLAPNSTGMRVDILIAEEAGEKKKIAQPFYIHWQAMGY